MTVRPAIHFDEPPPTPDEVTLAVLPVNGVTGTIVGYGVKARVKGLPDQPIVNGSGMLVFINLPPPPNPPEYLVEVDATEAGFFVPDTVEFEPPGANDADAEAKRRIPVLLTPRPEYPFPSGTTLVRGVLVRGTEIVSRARISAQPQLSSTPFETLSDERGTFALAIRPHPEALPPLELDIRFEEGADTRILGGKKLTSGRSHSFRDPVDLTGNNNPDFFTI
jgi:hypothetical protein